MNKNNSKLISDKLCRLCNKPIGLLHNAICNEEGYEHFDCVLQKLSLEKGLKQGQKISYVGKGNFAVVEMDENKTWKIIESFNYEATKENQAFKKEIQEMVK